MNTPQNIPTVAHPSCDTIDVGLTTPDLYVATDSVLNLDGMVHQRAVDCCVTIIEAGNDECGFTPEFINLTLNIPDGSQALFLPLTPDAARRMAASLILAAEHQEDIAANLSAAALARAANGGAR